MEKKTTFSFKTIIRGFLNAFNVERGFIPTIRDTIIKPKEVVDYYIEGNRGKYFTPGRFFVTVFAIAAIIIFFKPETDVTDQDQVMKDLQTFMQNPISSNIMLSAALIILPLGLISKILFYKSHYNLAMHYVAQIYCYCSIYFFFTIAGIFHNMLFKKFDMINLDKIDEYEDTFEGFAEYMIASDGLLILYPLYLLILVSLPFIYYTSALRNIFKKNYIHSFIKSIIIVISMMVTFMLIIAAHIYLMYNQGMIPQDYFWTPN